MPFNLSCNTGFAVLRTLCCMHCVVWFKKDLRLSDHAPLAWAAEQVRLHGAITNTETSSATGAAVLPLWVYEPQAWQQPDVSARHLGFANDCLAELQAHISQDQGTLLRCHGDMLQMLATAGATRATKP
jgi:deoxyribodipyrimidine photo-lyase